MSGVLPRRAVVAGVAAAAAMPGAVRVHAAGAWPSQPIRLIVPFAPGGSTDLVARLVAQGLQERLGQPLIIDNRPGAGATLGSQQAAAAAPDGYTLLMSNSASHGISPALYRTRRYDPVRDFAHVALVVRNPSVFVATPRFAPRSLGEVVRHSLETARGLDIASSGSGSSNHLLIVQFAQATGARVNHVPYRGAGPAMTDVIGGVVPMMSDSLPSAFGHLRGGAVRPVAISAAGRHPAFPDLPSFREQGVDLVSHSWFGLSAPAGTPAAIVERLNREVRAMLATPAVQARFTGIGGTVADLDAGAYTAFLQEELARWAPMVQASGAEVD
jgi:tripartite-type tricarboxylate transporter receptor subunit TctC